VTRRILILMSDQGGGHRAAALALREAVQRLVTRPVEVDVVDFVDLAKPGRSARLARVYRAAIDHAPTLYALVWRVADRAPGLGRLVARGLMPRARRGLRELLESRRPAAVVSVYPLANHETARVLAALDPRPPFVTVVTDLGRPISLWFAPGIDQYVVPCEGARARARRAGVPADRVRVLGLPVAAAFGAPIADRAGLRRGLGLAGARATVLVVGGGEGAGHLEGIARAIGASGLDLQLVLVTGRNEPLRRRLGAVGWEVPTKVEGYVTNMPDLMAASDVVVTKAGPHTVTEALTRGRPLLLSGFIPAQEEGTVRTVLEAGAGVLADSPAKVVDALRALLQPGGDAGRRMVARGQALTRPTAAEDIARLVLGLAGEAPRPR
jgi:1,2-diacylglycerol 3-beta-galactosyltransferase